MRPDVVIVPCADYSEGEAKGALERVLAPLGGLDWVRPGMKIAIKVNLVTFAKPEKAATTHPGLLCPLVGLLSERGADVVVGDSPGGLYNAGYVNRVYAATGMKAVEQYGGRLNQDFTEGEAKFPEGKVCRQFRYTAWLDGADDVIDLCKLKTHGMMAMTCGAKNMFGAIPGTVKPEYHFRYPDPRDFARMIVDLDEYFKPRLTLVDAVECMEGNGPSGGTPRHMGALLAAESPHKVRVAHRSEAGGGAHPGGGAGAGADPPLGGGAEGGGRPRRLCHPGFPADRNGQQPLVHRERQEPVRQTGRDGPEPGPGPAPPGQGRQMCGVRRVPEGVPGQRHHHGEGQAPHRPEKMYPLLLLPGILPGERHGGPPHRNRPAAGPVRHLPGRNMGLRATQ